MEFVSQANMYEQSLYEINELIDTRIGLPLNSTIQELAFTENWLSHLDFIFKNEIEHSSLIYTKRK